MSPRSFVSRRHKSRRDPKSRTGLQSGHVIAREGAQRPVMKLYIHILSKHISCRGDALHAGPSDNLFELAWI